jgi:membrane associated rhomboid family serine protease
MLPRIGSSKLVSSWILLTLGVSIFSMLDGGWLFGWAALAPDRIWHGEIWRIATWALLELGPLGLILTCASIYKFGGELAPRWGDRRLRRFAIQIVIAGGVAAALCGLISEDVWRSYRPGGWAISDALIIAWARQYPTSTIRLYGLLELSGRQLVGFTIGVTLLYAIVSNPLMMAPELVACLGAAYYPRAWLMR